MEYSFNIDIAKIYKVDAAVIIHNLFWWIRKNVANEKHHYDGRTWTYNTIKAFSELFPFYTEKEIRTILLKLKNCGAVVVGNYNKTPMDRTQWYSLSDDIIALYEKGKCILPNGQMGNSEDEKNGGRRDEIFDKYDEFAEQMVQQGSNFDATTAVDEDDEGKTIKAGEKDETMDNEAVFFMASQAELGQNSVQSPPILPNGQMHFTKWANAIYQTGKCNLPNGQMHFTKRANAYAQTGKCTIYKHKYKQVIKPINQSKLNIFNNITDITPLSPLSCKETDRLISKSTEISERARFYVDWFSNKIKEGVYADAVADISDRFMALVHAISRKTNILVHGNQLSSEDILESYISLFCDNTCRILISAYDTIDTKVAQGIVKNKFNYTVSTLYNAARL